MNIKIAGTIEIHVASMLAAYGDDPKQFMKKMNDLAIDWYCKGLSAGVQMEINKAKDKNITCPYCRNEIKKQYLNS